MSKAFTATAIGELVAEGKVDWDITPVSQYLPEFQLKDPVLTSQLTFADLLSHRTVSICLLMTFFFVSERSLHIAASKTKKNHFLCSQYSRFLKLTLHGSETNSRAGS